LNCGLIKAKIFFAYRFQVIEKCIYTIPKRNGLHENRIDMCSSERALESYDSACP
jgi:hypothetical protein